jgi:hypothetical protein
MGIDCCKSHVSHVSRDSAVSPLWFCRASVDSSGLGIECHNPRLGMCLACLRCPRGLTLDGDDDDLP